MIVEFSPGAGPFDVIPQTYLDCVGGAGSASTPDHASLDIVGNIQLIADVTLDDWTPTYNPVFLSKWTAASNQRSYIFWMFEGRLAIAWSPDGTLGNSVALAANALMPITSGRIAVRADLTVNFGGLTVVGFETGPAGSLVGPWTLVGTGIVNPGVASIFSGTAPLLVGNVGASEESQPLVGRVHAARVVNPAGPTTVANPDFSAQAVGAGSFADSTGKTWTVNAPATLAGFGWVDLSARLVSADWSEGRDDELEPHGAGEATIVLRNEDRQLDPDHATGTWFGKLGPRTPFRLRELVAGVPEDRFYGFVDGGFEQEYEPPKVATCKVDLVDRLSAVAGLLPDVFEHAVESRGPVGFWMLDGDAGAEAVADRSGNGHDGTVVGAVTFGEASIAAGHGTSARFDATATVFGRVEVSRSPLVAAPGSVSVVATFKARTTARVAGAFRVIFIQNDGAAETSATGVLACIDGEGQPRFNWLIGGAGISFEWPTSAVDGVGHIYFGQSDGLAIDTPNLSSATGSQGLGQANGVGVGGFQGIYSEDHWDGWICAVAVFDRLLGQADREFVMQGYTKLAGRRTDEHIGWALDRIGVPAEHRNLDAGTVLLGPADAAGLDALEFIREVVATEQGEFYVDHRDGGKLRFRHRYARFIDTRSTTSQASFSDHLPDVANVGIQVGGLEVAPNGIDGIVNEASVEWRDGEETVSDAVSVAAFGPQSRTVTTQATTAGQARSAGEWLVANNAQPRARVRGITTRPDASAKALDAARQVRPGDRVSYRLHPQQVGAPTAIDLFVEGVDHSISDGTVRVATYRLAPVNTFVPWIWGTSAWNTTKVWG